MSVSPADADTKGKDVAEVGSEDPVAAPPDAPAGNLPAPDGPRVADRLVQ